MELLRNRMYGGGEDNLQLYIRGNNTIADTSKNNIATTGTAITYTTDHFGNANSAIALNGTTSKVVTNFGVPLIASDKVTICFWIRYSNTGNAHFVGSDYWFNINNNYGCQNYSTSKLALGDVTTPPTLYNIMQTANLSLNNNAWIFLTFEFDRSQAAINQNKVYINNVLQTTSFISTAYDDDTSGAFADQVTNIGGGAAYGSVNGAMSHIAIFNRLLTADEKTAQKDLP